MTDSALSNVLRKKVIMKKNYVFKARAIFEVEVWATAESEDQARYLIKTGKFDNFEIDDNEHDLEFCTYKPDLELIYIERA
jgi:hypothetical protein